MTTACCCEANVEFRRIYPAGGQQLTARRFANNAQEFRLFPRRSGRYVPHPSRERATWRALIAAAKAAAGSDTYAQLNLLGDVFERVRADYVEKPDDAKLVEGAINGMVSSLDPHSRYMNEQAWRDMQETTHGEFGGLGIEVTMEDGLVKVVSPMDGTPAARAGIMSGDLITSIDGEAVQGLTLEQAVNKMKGPVHATTQLKIVRKGSDSQSTFRSSVKSSR